MIFGTHTHSINKLLHQIQQESQKYNMRLNLDKCVNLTLNQNQSSVKYMNGHKVPRKAQATYLGATLTDAVDNHKEILQKIGEANATANQLGILWSKARISKKWKLTILDSVVMNNLLYGLETMQLPKSDQDRIDAFQMKMLRRVLTVPPTHIDREWTNRKVVDELKLRAQYQHVKLSDRWQQRKITLLGHILRAPADDPMKQILFEQGTDRPRIEHTRRVGKPRANWFVESCRDAYTICDPNTEFDEQSIAQTRVLVTKANNREAPFN